MQAYTAYYRSGSIVFDDNVSAPEGSRAIVTFLDDLPDEKQKENAAAWADFFAEIDGCNEEIQDFERIKFREVEV